MNVNNFKIVDQSTPSLQEREQALLELLLAINSQEKELKEMKKQVKVYLDQIEMENKQ